MPTIHDLPLEIIKRIIIVAFPVTPAGTREPAPRSQFLLAASLVCRDWTPFAQRELRQDVFFSMQTIDGFQAAGPGRYPVRKLEVFLLSLRDELVEKVLPKVQGVSELELVGGRICGEWLCGENLKNLQVLYLRFITITPSTVAASLPFRLTSLVLEFEYDPSSSGLVDALARQASITSLSLRTHYFNTTALFARLALLAPQLTTLEIACHEDRSGSAADFIKHCTQLKHLSICRQDLAVFSHAVATLSSLTISSFKPLHVPTLLDILESAPAAVTKLERVTLRRTLAVDYQQMREHPRWAELEQRCRETKIELIVEHWMGEE